MAAELQIESEVERIERWRYEALVRAGYDASAARRLSENQDVDLHVAVELLEQGCDPELAVNILL